MHDLVTLVVWSFGGFWRWLGFFLLTGLVTGGAWRVLGYTLTAIGSRGT